VTTTGDEPDTPDEPAAPRPINELPDAVRQRVVEWAADALGAAGPTEIPVALARVARFAPHKRARVAAAALGQAVQNDAAFRALVAQRAVGEDVPAGEKLPADGESADPVQAAARAYLLRLPDSEELLRAASDVDRRRDDRARIVELEREVRTLRSELAAAEAELRRSRAAAEQPRSDSETALERLRLRLREQGSRMRELQQAVDSAAADTKQTLANLVAERDKSRAEAEMWRQRAEASTARAEVAAQNLQRTRESAGDRRAASDRRLELLLSALEGAASGLRREWDLIGGGAAPADVVAARLPPQLSDSERTADPTRLSAWLGLPGAHLIVDGYNVTKTGFPGLSLSDQRDRLVRSLGALAARTSAEVTVVFDGAAVATARPPARGIRVLFSPPGVTADDVIADLVRAEPVGRVLVVVSSDRQVADTAGRHGARTAGSPVLLGIIGV
jgi:hypothetical protein